VRVLECKFGHHAGWHPHLHVLLFLRPVDTLETVVGNLYVAILQRWSVVTEAAGYAASIDAQDMREVRDEHLDRIAGYLTKEQDIASEMTGQDWKSSATHLSPLGLLRAAAAGEDWAAQRYREYELATKGRRLYASASPALRDAIAAAAEPDEHQASQEPVATVRERLAVVPRPHWQGIARVPGLRGDLAQVVEEAVDGWGVVDFVARRGYLARIYDPAAPEERAAAIPDDVHAAF
jgi:hypothetical protein